MFVIYRSDVTYILFPRSSAGLPSSRDQKSSMPCFIYSKSIRPDMDATIELAATLNFPQFQRDTEYVAPVSDNSEYPMLMGDIGSTDGISMNKKDYKKITNEFVVPHSSAKHTKLSRTSYAVGALARFNLNAGSSIQKPKKWCHSVRWAKPKAQTLSEHRRSIGRMRALSRRRDPHR